MKIVNILVRRNLKIDGARMFEDYILIQCDQMRGIEWLGSIITLSVFIIKADAMAMLRRADLMQEIFLKLIRISETID